jgi:hypothetical protein
MLASLTLIVNLVSMTSALWMAFYLFARGFPNRVTMRACLALLALSVFFLGTYNSFFIQNPDATQWRALLLIIGFASWYSATFQLLSLRNQGKFRKKGIGIYALCLTAAFLILTAKSDLFRGVKDVLYGVYAGSGFIFAFYGFVKIAALLGAIFNLWVEEKSRFKEQGKYFLFDSLLLPLTFVYVILAFMIPEPPAPRIIGDALVFCGIILMGASVARNQSLIKRRATLYDFPVTGLTMLGVVALCLWVGYSLGAPIAAFGYIAAFVVAALSIYDLSREFLERARLRAEGDFRKQLYLIENKKSNDENFQTLPRLQEGLQAALKTLSANAGLIAVRRDEKMVVTASQNALSIGAEISAEFAADEDVSRADGRIPNIVWVSCVYEGQTQIALVGIGEPSAKLDYSAGDLELFAEFANRVGTMISIANLQPQANAQIRQLADESKSLATEMNSVVDEMLEALASNPKAEFIKTVEDGLRKFSDALALAQSPLADFIGAADKSRFERGKQTQRILREAIESLRPSGTRPEEALPRAWYNYAVLHDAYVKDVPNREIMARLYISEGTFNRTRRDAVRDVARWLAERSRTGG